MQFFFKAPIQQFYVTPRSSWKMPFFLLILLIIKIEVRAGETNSSSLFTNDSVHEIRISFSQKGFWDTLTANYDKYHNIDTLDKYYLMADMNIDGVRLDSVGVKFKGNFTYSAPTKKKPMKIDFNVYVKGKRYEGLRAINLSNNYPDPSLLRNMAALTILKIAGLKAPETSFAKVYVNNIYWGLYSVVEQIDKSFLTKHFNNNDGALIKGVASSLFWVYDDTASFHRNFEIKTKNNPDSWSRLIALTEKIDKTPGEIFYDSLSLYFDFDSFIPVMAADVIFNNWDSYFFGQNYYLYLDSFDNKFHFLPWDYNLSLNSNKEKGDFEILPGGTHNYFFQLPLPVKILKNEKLKTKYLNELCRINKIMQSDTLKNYLTSIHSMIRPALLKDSNKTLTMEEFDNSLFKKLIREEMDFTGILDYINRRGKQINEMLNLAGHKCPDYSN